MIICGGGESDSDGEKKSHGERGSFAIHFRVSRCQIPFERRPFCQIARRDASDRREGLGLHLRSGYIAVWELYVEGQEFGGKIKTEEDQ